MYFDELIGLKERTGQDIIIRQAVRAISIKDNKLLMIVSNQGDYRLPGGGIERMETHHEALVREVGEETGYVCKRISSLVGKVLERKIDKFEENKIFEMTSYYYACEVSDEIGKQSLDGYELKLGFKPVWVNIHEAIKKNREIQKLLDKKKIWIQRENYVLNKVNGIEIKELLMNIDTMT